MKASIFRAMLGLSLLAGLGLAAQGCAAAALGAGAAAGVATHEYIEGTVSRTYDATPEQAQRAIELTMQELGMSNVTYDQDPGHLEINARTFDDSDVEVEIRPVSAGQTEITVRIERMPDEDRALDFHRRLERHLQRTL